jgi:molecular chaperone DnaK
LRAAAERAKGELSTAQNTNIRLPELMARLPGGVPISRDRLESLTQDLVDRTVWPCETVLRDAKWSVEDVDVLVMVGGQTNMPRVRAHIAEWLGKEPLAAATSPESLVALGTARQGIALSAGRKRRKGEVAIAETTCLSLGLESAGGVLTRLIPKGTRLPATALQALSTSADGQAQVLVHLLQGEREMAADNDSIARLQIGPLAPAPRGTPQIELEILTDGGGVPRAMARDATTGEPIPVRVRPSGGLTEAEIAALSAAHAGSLLPASVPGDGVPGDGVPDVELIGAPSDAHQDPQKKTLQIDPDAQRG